jgi:hypothetical protein
MTGPLEVTSANFSGGTTAAYSFTNLPAGEYMLYTNQFVAIGSNNYGGKAPPDRIFLTGTQTYNFSLANISSGGTSVTVNVTGGPASEPMEVSAGGPTGFRAIPLTLDGDGEGTATLYLADGQWNVSVGPRHQEGPMSGPAAMPTTYLPPRSQNVNVTNPSCSIEGTQGTCTANFVLATASKVIR